MKHLGGTRAYSAELKCRQAVLHSGVDTRLGTGSNRWVHRLYPARMLDLKPGNQAISGA